MHHCTTFYFSEQAVKRLTFKGLCAMWGRGNTVRMKPYPCVFFYCLHLLSANSYTSGTFQGRCVCSAALPSKEDGNSMYEYVPLMSYVK